MKSKRRKWPYVVLAVLIFLGFGIARIVSRGNKLDAESRAFANETVPSLLKSWSAVEFLKVASPDIFAGIGKADMALQDLKNQYGSLLKIDPFKCNATIFYSSSAGDLTNASCQASATFEKQPGVVLLQIVLKEDMWKIKGLSIFVDYSRK